MTTPQTLRDLAAKATPGPWGFDERTGIVAVYPGDQRGCLAGETFIHSKEGRWDAVAGRWHMDPQDVADAAYIAAISPDVLTGLLDRLEAAERDSTRFAKALTEYGVHHGNCPLDSWSDGLTKCKCGLFRLIKDANRLLSQPHSAEPTIDVDETMRRTIAKVRENPVPLPDQTDIDLHNLRVPYGISQPHSAEGGRDE